MSDDGTNQLPPGRKHHDSVLEFTRLALGGRRVSPEAWKVGCQVAEAAMRAATRVVPVELLEVAFARACAAANQKLVDAQKHNELMLALEAFGMGKSYPNDSATVRRVKRAFESMKWSEPNFRISPEDIRSGFPMPEDPETR